MGAVFLAVSGQPVLGLPDRGSKTLWEPQIWKNEVNTHQVLMVCQALLKVLYCMILQ